MSDTGHFVVLNECKIAIALIHAGLVPENPASVRESL